MPAAICALRLNWDIDARLRSHKSANELGVLLVPVNYTNGAVAPTVQYGSVTTGMDLNDDFTSVAAWDIMARIRIRSQFRFARLTVFYGCRFKPIPAVS